MLAQRAQKNICPYSSCSRGKAGRHLPPSHGISRIMQFYLILAKKGKILCIFMILIAICPTPLFISLRKHWQMLSKGYILYHKASYSGAHKRSDAYSTAKFVDFHNIALYGWTMFYANFWFLNSLYTLSYTSQKCFCILCSLVIKILKNVVILFKVSVF